MKQITEDSVVDIYYQGKLENGKIVFSNIDQKPLEFKLGDGNMLPGIEENIIGMKKGDEKQIIVPPEKGFGFPKEKYIKEFKKSEMPEKVINRGDVYQYKDEKSGKTVHGTVTKIKRETVVIDFNHFAAGKTLIFNIKIEDVKNN